MPDMNHALCVVPPLKELVKSCEAVPFLIHFLRLIYLCRPQVVFFVFFWGGGAQIYCHQRRGAKHILLCKHEKIKTQKEMEQTAEPIMRGGWDNQQNQGHAKMRYLIPKWDFSDQLTFAEWVFGKCSKLNRPRLKLCCTPHQCDREI